MILITFKQMLSTWVIMTILMQDRTSLEDLLHIAVFGIWQGLKNQSVVEVVLTDDVAGPGNGPNQHAEVDSGPVIIIAVVPKTSCFTRKAPKVRAI